MASISSTSAVSQIEHRCAYAHRDLLGKGGTQDRRSFSGTGGSLTDRERNIRYVEHSSLAGAHEFTVLSL